MVSLALSKRCKISLEIKTNKNLGHKSLIKVDILYIIGLKF